MKIKSFPEGSTGHDIVDEVVIANQSRNQELFNMAGSYPPYFGAVNIGEHKVKLSTVKGKSKLGQQPLIWDIIDGVKGFKLEPGNATINIVADGAVTKTINVHPELVKLIKVCLASSYSANEDFSIVVSEFVKSLIDMAEHINLPIGLPSNNKMQKIIGAELNEFLKKICDDNGIQYQDVIDIPKKRKKSSPLIDAAKKVATK
jgi:hypothetical protein